MASFKEIFQTGHPLRDKYLARIFGILSEDLVRIWSRCPQASYADLGRPTVRSVADVRGYTLDFTLRRRSDAAVFIAEMKCELEYEGYRYLQLTSPSQLAHHKRRAFQLFLEGSANPASVIATVRGKPQPHEGGVLIWGSCSTEGRAAVTSQFGFRDVLSLEDIIRDLQAWKPDEWADKLSQLRDWQNYLLDCLGGLGPTS